MLGGYRRTLGAQSLRMTCHGSYELGSTVDILATIERRITETVWLTREIIEAIIGADIDVPPYLTRVP